MNKKADIPPVPILALEIIGGVIVVAIMFVIFTSFASPFLEFMSDYENQKAFNKFTKVLSTSCDSGTGTEYYFGISSASQSKTYSWVLLHSQTANAVQDMTLDCDFPPCTTQNSKEKIDRCKRDFCWCLLKIKRENDDCPAGMFNAITIDKGAVTIEPKTVASQTSGGNWEEVHATRSVVQTFMIPNTDDDEDEGGEVININLYGYYPNYEGCKGDLRDLIVRIMPMKDGEPDKNDIIGSARIRPSIIADAEDVFAASFAGALVEEEKEYAVVLSTANSPNCEFKWAINKGGGYSDGKAQYDEGNGWTDAGGDMFFEVRIRLLSSAYNSLRAWDGDLSETFRTSDMFEKVVVVQCTQVRDELRCEKEGFPVLPVYEDRYPVWIQPWFEIVGVPTVPPTEFSVTPKLYFDSLSADRPVIQSGEQMGQFNYWTNLLPSTETFETKEHTGGIAEISEEC